MNFLKTFYNFIFFAGKYRNDNQLAFEFLTGKIMTTLEDIKMAIAKTAENVAKEKEEVTSALFALTQEVTDLKSKLSAGVVVNTGDLDSILLSINTIGEGVKTIYSAPAEEAAPVVTEAPAYEEPVVTAEC